MNQEPEIIEIGLDDNLKSSNFGGGLELLMNDKKSHKNNASVDFEDLNILEKELNDISQDYDTLPPKSPQEYTSDLFNITKNNENTEPKIKFDDIDTTSDYYEKEKSPSIGRSTAHFNDEQPNWDGYQKFNANINPDKATPTPQMSKEELLKEKFKYLKKLEALEKKVELSKKYTMESSLSEMQGEYESIMEEKNKSNSVKFQGNMMMAFINGLEFLNGRFDPFDIKLDGLSDQVTENITDYDEVFGELYEKYKSKASLAPELKLLFQLGGSAMMVHMTNTMFKSSMPNMDDVLRQNPDLMRSFQQAAVNSMSSNAPGLSSFMDGMLNDTNRRGPPPPIPTQRQENYEERSYSKQPESDNYSNRGGNNPYGQFKFGDEVKEDGIRINERQTTLQQSKRGTPIARTEMKGPSDINDLLGKLKTKKINIRDNHEYNPNLNENDYTNMTNNSSTISVNEIRKLDGNIQLPKKSNRKKSSEKNMSSMDINI